MARVARTGTVKPRRGELPDEFRARKLRAKLVVQYLRAAERAARVSLGTYAAADRGRRNRDWNAGNVSADGAIIPDADTINPRARQMVRDSWIAKAIVRSFVRNVAGRGITPAPVARSAGGTDRPGTELVGLNDRAERLFWEWASDPSLCDVEGRQTFWAKQGTCVADRITVGQHFLVWTYTGPGQANVGLKLQSFETEQLDTTLFDYQGNEVRGGIEVDAYGAPIAYHFYERHPNDLYGRWPIGRKSRRIEKRFVFHYMRQERTLQTHGVSEMTSVLQRMRDFHRRDEAEMFAAIMESNIGLIIQKNFSTAPGSPVGIGGLSGIGSGPGGDTTPGGMRTCDWVPGMVFEGQPGEEVKGFTPQRPGGSYDPFARMQLRGISAGVGLSYDQVTRDFDQGTWHSKRQGTLEDQREWRMEQDLLIDTIVLPVYELWFALAVAEGWLPLSVEKYASDPKRYSEAEYVGDVWQWTSPTDEVSALKTAVEQGFITRKEIIAGRGGRVRGTFQQLKAEREMAREHNLTLPEEQDALINSPAKAEADALGTAVRAGLLTPSLEDEEHFRAKHGLPAPSQSVKDAWEKDGGARRPITIQQDAGASGPNGGDGAGDADRSEGAAGAGAGPGAGSSNGNGNGNGRFSSRH